MESDQADLDVDDDPMIQAAMRMDCWQKHGFLKITVIVSKMIETFQMS